MSDDADERGPEPSPPSADGPPQPPVSFVANDPQPPQTPERPSYDPWAHRRGEPRTFAAGWILFLFGATLVSVGAFGVMGLLTADVYRPAARVMIEITAVGVAVLWPMVRLSQEAPRHPLLAIAQDIIIMLGPVQAVLWPQALTWMAGWSIEVVACVDVLICGWAALIGGLLGVYFAAESRRVATAARLAPGRWAMMVAVIVLLGAGPLIAVVIGPVPGRAIDPATAPVPVEWLMTSPLSGVYEITRDRSWTGQWAVVDERHWIGAALPWAVAAISWIGAVCIAKKSRR